VIEEVLEAEPGLNDCRQITDLAPRKDPVGLVDDHSRAERHVHIGIGGKEVHLILQTIVAQLIVLTKEAYKRCGGFPEKTIQVSEKTKARRPTEYPYPRVTYVLLKDAPARVR
jgi:hypothetical protein